MSNSQKLREVLKSASERLRKATESERYGEDVLYLVGCMRSVAQECDHALSYPLQNGDIGTADEQAERFLTFCTNHQTCDDCSECPLYGSDRCEIAWTQMPYEEQKEIN